MKILLEEIPDWYWSQPQESKDSDSWNEYYQVLLHYVKEHNKIPSALEVYNGSRIGSWCFYQRQNILNNGTLTTTKKHLVPKLEAVPGWWWTEISEKRTKSSWDECFIRFQTSVAKYGRMPTRAEDNTVSGWAKYQRQLYHKGGLPTCKQNKLESVTGWYWDIDAWQQSFDSVKEFHNENGRLPTTTEKDSVGYGIGSWCTIQRSKQRAEVWSSDDARRVKLESLNGWIWGADTVKKAPLSWDEMFDLIKEFIKRHDRLPKQLEKYKDIKLGGWVTQQRTTFKKGTIDEDRKIKLENTKGWAWVSKKP
jgi:hypothetical protein